MYEVLARKWRPKTFHELVGQQHVRQALTYALDHNCLHHAYLLTGTRGVGKTTIARIFAKSLNCKTNGVSANPCGECEHCLEIDMGRFPDLIEVDAASRTGVEDTRNLLDNVPYAPVKGRYKVYLIDEVHMFSNSSFNALLKTLEEPPQHVKFILATTDPQKMPATVISRCLQFHLKNMRPEQITTYMTHVLKESHIGYEVDALKMLAEAADGSMRDGLSLLDQAIAYGQGSVQAQDVAHLLGAVPQTHILEIMQSLTNGDAQAVRRCLSTLESFSPDYQSLLKTILYRLQDISIIQMNAVLDEGYASEWYELAERIPVELLQLWYQIATDGWQTIPYHPDAKLCLEMTLLRMIALRPVLPTTDLTALKRIPEAQQLEVQAVVEDPALQQSVVQPDEPFNIAQSPETDAKLEQEVLPEEAHAAMTTSSVNSPPWENKSNEGAEEHPHSVTDITSSISVVPQNSMAPEVENVSVTNVVQNDSMIATSQQSANHSVPLGTLATVDDRLDALKQAVGDAKAWAALINAMQLPDYTSNLLRYCTLDAVHDECLTLSMDAIAVHMNNATQEGKIESVLPAWLGQQIAVECHPLEGENTQAPAQIEQRYLADKQRETVEGFLAHPTVQLLKQTLGASVEPNGIQFMEKPNINNE